MLQLYDIQIVTAINTLLQHNIAFFKYKINTHKKIYRESSEKCKKIVL